jgi:hypothetical protein
MRKVDCPSVLLIYFYIPALTRSPLSLDRAAVFSEHSPLCVQSHIDWCRLQRELGVHCVFEEYHLCTSCIVWEIGFNIVAFLLSYALV